MGWLKLILGSVFGGGRNVVKETAEVFRPNAEASEARTAAITGQAMSQYAAEFTPRAHRTWFDSFVDGINRLVRPLLAMSCFGILVATPIDPIYMTEVFTAWALIPAALWGIIGGVFGFFFGGRFQIKAHEMKRDLAEVAARAPQVVESIRALRELRHDSPGAADTGNDAGTALAAVEPSENAALDEWKRKAG
jgi:hypothetical protein